MDSCLQPIFQLKEYNRTRKSGSRNNEWRRAVSNRITGIGIKEALRGTAFSSLYNNHMFDNMVENVYNGFYNYFHT
ncbi:MAG: hypothetical protein IPN18_14995 [Ignavibacteriales bacterium]|nr:hypothetical protein [Ignavibacteriales bacterium]